MNPQTQENITFTVFVHDTISVSGETITSVWYGLIMSTVGGGDTVMSVQEYRRLLGDENTPDALISQRLWYIENLCRSIINSELYPYGGEN